MKFVRIIAKNFKLLIRAKASAFIVLLGPLIIILLVGLAFSTKATYELGIGYVTSEKNNLTGAFVDSLKQSHYQVQEFNSEDDCVKKIEQGIIHTCIIFPPGFKVSNENSSELRFLVDYSRINMVYNVIDSVSGILDVESKELSYSLTQTLLSRINLTINDLKQEAGAANSTAPKLSQLSSDLQRIKSDLDSMKFDIGAASTSSVREQIISLNQSLAELIATSSELANQSDDWIDALDSHGENVSSIRKDFANIQKDLSNLYNVSPQKIQDLLTGIDKFSKSLDQLRTDLNASKKLNIDAQAKTKAAIDNVAGLQSSLADLKKALEKTRQNLESISITSAQTIVSPVNTKIEPIMLETSKLTFTFPYLLVLIIMFVALLLSSTLVIFEKSSKAYFRNHITPTRQETFVVTTFVSSIIVIISQTIIILGLANYFMHIPLFKNVLCTVLLLLFTIIFFIVLGMAIGYLFSTHEGAVMSSIVLGSVFMFLSNLVIPLESLAPGLTKIIKYNPYVLSSELLRKSLLFTVNIKTDALLTLAMLAAASLLIFALMIIITGLKNNKKIRQHKEAAVALGNEYDSNNGRSEQWQDGGQAKQALPFVVGERKAFSLEKLHKLVSEMTRAEYEDNVARQGNKIADWVESSLQEKKLAARLRKAETRKELLKALSGEIRRKAKKQSPDDASEHQESSDSNDALYKESE